MNLTFPLLKLDKIVLLVSILIIFNSCKKEPEETPINNPGTPTDYDASLTSALIDASPSSNLDYYTLPYSFEYSNIPQDPNNNMTNAKVELGKLLFHETAIGTNPKIVGQGEASYSCASCHHGAAGFQAGVQQGIGEGGMGFGIHGEGRVFDPSYPLDSIDLQPLRSPSIMNGAYQEVTLWNGAFGALGPNLRTEHLWGPASPMWNNHFGHAGLESQAIGGLTVHRMEINEEFMTELGYKAMFDQAFPTWPQATRYTVRTAGLAIGAYERSVLSNEAPFQDWLNGNSDAMTENQKKGAVLFFDKGKCVQCHTGPALNTMSFHALGMADMFSGSQTFISEDFQNANKGRGGFTQEPDDLYKFKTPQLYNLKDSPFYGHGGTFNSVKEVIEYKNEAVGENPNVAESRLSSMFVPLDLTEAEINQMVDFIENALYDANLMRYVPTEILSGNCFPNNDETSVFDQGCQQ